MNNHITIWLLEIIIFCTNCNRFPWWYLSEILLYFLFYIWYNLHVHVFWTVYYCVFLRVQKKLLPNFLQPLSAIQFMVCLYFVYLYSFKICPWQNPFAMYMTVYLYTRFTFWVKILHINFLHSYYWIGFVKFVIFLDN